MISSINDTIRNSDPLNKIYEEEFTGTMISFCTYICLLFNKRMNLPNIFITLLQYDDIRETFKELLEMDSDYEVYKLFLEYEPSLHKSKYIKKYINQMTNQ